MNPFLIRFLLLCLFIGCVNGFAQQRATSRTAAPSKTSIQLRIDALWLQAGKLADQQQHQQAIDLFRDALHLSRVHNEPLRAANLYGHLGTAYHNLGQYEIGLNECRTGLSVLPSRASGADSIRFKLEYAMGSIHQSANRFDSAQAHFDVAELLLKKKPHLERVIPYPISTFYITLSVFADQTENNPKVLLYAEKALHVAKRYSLSDMLPTAYNSIGSYHQEAGDFKKAIDQYILALHNTKSAYERSVLSNNIGTLLLEYNHNEEALHYLRQALLHYQKLIANDPGQQSVELSGKILTNLGICNTRLRRFGEAGRYFDKAVSVLTHNFGTHHQRLAEVYVERGEWLEAQQEWAAALVEYQKALHASYWNGLRPGLHEVPPIDDGVISAVSLFDVLRHRAHAIAMLHHQQGNLRNLRTAFETYQTALRLSERIRRSYEGAEAKVFFAQKVRPVYEQALDITFRLFEQTNQPVYREAAFGILEGSKAAALADALRESRLKPTTLPAQLLNEEKRLNRDLAELRVKLASARDSLQMQVLKVQLIELQIQLNQVLRQFDRVSPRYYHFRYAQNKVPLQQARQALPDAQTALISYFLGTDYFYVFAIRKEGEVLQRHPITPNFKQTLDTLRKTLYANPGLDEYRGSTPAQRAHQVLIHPLLGQLAGIRRLIVLRDAELHFIPFEVLEARPGQYLVQHFAIRYAYSVALLLESPKKKAPFNEHTLVVAPYADSTGIGTAVRNEGLGALPASRHEARAVGGEILLNQEATKSAFLQHYPEYDVLHLATHARADSQDPSKSFIAFFPGPTPYKLYTNELYNLSLDHTRLVVLSACETGSGLLQGGEGIMSLARAFMYAGCPSVITTLWNAHDESSAYLSERLHEYVRKGVALDEALQRAKLDYVQSEQGRPYNHPYYWANLVLIGEGQALYQAEKRSPTSSPWLMVGGVGLLVLVMLILVALRSRHLPG